MKRSLMMSLALAAVALVLASPALAQQGFYVGTGVGAAIPVMSGDVMDVNPGVGLNLEVLDLGYNFTDQFGVSLQVGGAMGRGQENFIGEYLDWKQGYIGLAGRFILPMEPLSPYLELGITDNLFFLEADEATFATEAALGLRAALGGTYQMGELYLAPEVAYLYVNYEEAEIKLDDPGPGQKDEFQVEFDSRGSMIILQLKVGWQPGG